MLPLPLVTAHAQSRVDSGSTSLRPEDVERTDETTSRLDRGMKRLSGSIDETPSAGAAAAATTTQWGLRADRRAVPEQLHEIVTVGTPVKPAPASSPASSKAMSLRDLDGLPLSSALSQTSHTKSSKNAVS